MRLKIKVCEADKIRSVTLKFKVGETDNINETVN